jgi:hypothetical protein
MIRDLKRNGFISTTLKFLIDECIMEKLTAAKFFVLLISSLFWKKRNARLLNKIL